MDGADLADAGANGARRIGLDVVGGPGARLLSGLSGEVSLQHSFPGTVRRHFDWISRPFSRTGSWAYVGLPGGCEVGVRTWAMVGSSAESYDLLPGQTGVIEHEYLSVENKSVRSRWTWCRRAAGQTRAQSSDTSLVVADTEVEVHYSGSRGTDGPFTTIVLAHRKVPTEWVEDLTHWWCWQLALHAGRP